MLTAVSYLITFTACFANPGLVWRRELGVTSHVPNGHQALPAVFPSLSLSLVKHYGLKVQFGG